MLLGAGIVMGSAPEAMPKKAVVKVVAGGESAVSYRECRRMLVGPGVNQPDPHPGYAGFVGWQHPIRLRDGTILALRHPPHAAHQIPCASLLHRRA